METEQTKCISREFALVNVFADTAADYRSTWLEIQRQRRTNQPNTFSFGPRRRHERRLQMLFKWREIYPNKIQTIIWVSCFYFDSWITHSLWPDGSAVVRSLYMSSWARTYFIVCWSEEQDLVLHVKAQRMKNPEKFRRDWELLLQFKAVAESKP